MFSALASLIVIGRDISRQMDGKCVCVCVCVAEREGVEVLGMRTVWGSSRSHTI